MKQNAWLCPTGTTQVHPFYKTVAVLSLYQSTYGSNLKLKPPVNLYIFCCQNLTVLYVIHNTVFILAQWMKIWCADTIVTTKRKTFFTTKPKTCKKCSYLKIGTTDFWHFSNAVPLPLNLSTLSTKLSLIHVLVSRFLGSTTTVLPHPNVACNSKF